MVLQYISREMQSLKWNKVKLSYAAQEGDHIFNHQSALPGLIFRQTTTTIYFLRRKNENSRVMAEQPLANWELLLTKQVLKLILIHSMAISTGRDILTEPVSVYIPWWKSRLQNKVTWSKSSPTPPPPLSDQQCYSHCT